MTPLKFSRYSKTDCTVSAVRNWISLSLTWIISFLSLNLIVDSSDNLEPLNWLSGRPRETVSFSSSSKEASKPRSSIISTMLDDSNSLLPISTEAVFSTRDISALTTPGVLERALSMVPKSVWFYRILVASDRSLSILNIIRSTDSFAILNTWAACAAHSSDRDEQLNHCKIRELIVCWLEDGSVSQGQGSRQLQGSCS